MEGNKAIVVEKYIITDDFKPMYAMREIHGPLNGPLRTPVRTPIKIVEKLLRQDKGPKLYEVVPEGKTFAGNVIYSERVELTLENYKMSYYEIAQMKRPIPTEVISVEDKKKGSDNIVGELLKDEGTDKKLPMGTVTIVEAPLVVTTESYPIFETVPKNEQVIEGESSLELDNDASDNSPSDEIEDNIESPEAEVTEQASTVENKTPVREITPKKNRKK